MNSEHDERLERHQVVLDDDKKHNLNCRRREEVGNWPSKQLLQNNKQLKRQEEELSNFLKKRENGELLIQKTARLYENFLAPVQQQPMVEKTFIVFDQTIQLIACDMPEIVPGKGLLTLSVVVNEPHINRCQEIDQHCELSCAPSTDLIARNAFVIRRVQPQLQCSDVSNVEYLKYGEDFLLECYSSCKQPLLVYSMPKNPFASSQCDNVVFKAHGEMKQCVGLALQKANNGAKTMTSMSNAQLIDESIPNAFFCWRFYHINPELRYETIGENIPVCKAFISTFGLIFTHICFVLTHMIDHMD
ncbi:hypothetical protein PVAND_006881 [Polypedilum vanderplanki]|uniref:Uncharacterized protein n=1 Tax=Polypedilum vanderplanki TaxID=319348 RepID=A0A9J6C503_POLVA|nr:hypothetical protein PVAND_006881 [Polypedilum vanderplanki]